jgi:tetratricopeptide (TPR) repeat protein
LVLVVEDLHWAEPTLLDVLAGLVDRSVEAPLLILCTARPEFLDEHPRWGGGKMNSASLLLQPLSSDDSKELLRGAAGGSDLPVDVASSVLATAEGNPLFIEQILSMLVDAGVLARGQDGWAAGGAGPIRIPTTIQTLLASRLDRLSPPARSVVRRAAVIGTEFRAADIADIARDDESEDVEAALASLVDKEWIRRERGAEPDRYRFRHMLMQASAYESIPKLVRAQLHERFADRLEVMARERIAEVEELIGHHLWRAVAYRTELGVVDDPTHALAARAARRLRAAGDRAFLRGDMPAAVTLFAAAAELFEPDHAERTSLLPRFGTSLVEVARFDDAERVLDEAWERSVAAGDLATQADTLFYRTELLARLGRIHVPAAAAIAQAMLPALEAAGLEASLSRCHRVLAVCNRDVVGYGQESERAMEHARRTGDRLSQLEILQNLADVTLALDHPVDHALARCDELIAIAGDDVVAVNALRTIAIGPLLALAGRFDEARAEIAAALEAFEGLGLELWLADAGAMGASEVEWLAGDLPASARYADQGLTALEAMGATSSAHRHLGRLALVAYLEGRLDDANVYVRSGYEGGAWSTQAVGAMLAAQRGACEEAERLARNHLERDRNSFNARLAEHHRLEAMMALAEVLRTCGRADEAADVTRAIVARAGRRGDVASVRIAEAWFADELTTRRGT